MTLPLTMCRQSGGSAAGAPFAIRTNRSSKGRTDTSIRNCYASFHLQSYASRIKLSMET